VILISHDRDLINTFATKVVEVRDRRLYGYTGDYEAFVAKRELELEQLEAAAKNQARRVAQLELFINRFRYKKSLASRVQSKVKMLDKMERVEAPSRGRKKMNLIFPPPPRSGRVVIEMKHIRFGYPDVPVYEDLNFVMERGQKVALVGPNGAGKSTLLKLIAGAHHPQAGERRLGHNVELGYFAQHQVEALTITNTVMQELRGSIPPRVDVDARKLLGRFLFSGDAVDKRISVLSGGEKTRLALAKLLVSPVNLLCLDEPTNHLDMWSRDVLEEALQQYDGTLVFITHDRHLIRNVANHTVEVVNGRVTEYHGDYDYYLSKKAPEEEKIARDKPRSVGPRSSGPKTKEQKRQEAEARAATKNLRDRIDRAERRLEKIDAELAEMEASFADPAFYATADDVAIMTQRYESRKRKRDELEAEWAEAVESLELEESKGA
jgi:ATP-binding cassette subfamily F protein 3